MTKEECDAAMSKAIGQIMAIAYSIGTDADDAADGQVLASPKLHFYATKILEALRNARAAYEGIRGEQP